jgi:hypothetical protein
MYCFISIIRVVSSNIIVVIISISTMVITINVMMRQE